MMNFGEGESPARQRRTHLPGLIPLRTSTEHARRRGELILRIVRILRTQGEPESNRQYRSQGATAYFGDCENSEVRTSLPNVGFFEPDVGLFVGFLAVPDID